MKVTSVCSACDRLQMLEVELALGGADPAVGILQHGQKQVPLAAEVVIEHALVGLRPCGDRVDSRPAQAQACELGSCRSQDALPRRDRVASACCGARGRFGFLRRALSSHGFCAFLSAAAIPPIGRNSLILKV